MMQREEIAMGESVARMTEATEGARKQHLREAQEKGIITWNAHHQLVNYDIRSPSIKNGRWEDWR